MLRCPPSIGLRFRDRSPKCPHQVGNVLGRRFVCRTALREQNLARNNSVDARLVPCNGIGNGSHRELALREQLPNQMRFTLQRWPLQKSFCLPYPATRKVRTLRM